MGVIGADQAVCDVIRRTRGVYCTPFLQKLLDVLVVAENYDIDGPEFEAHDGTIGFCPVAEPPEVSRWGLRKCISTYNINDFVVGIRWRFPTNGLVGGPGGKPFGRELASA